MLTSIGKRRDHNIRKRDERGKDGLRLVLVMLVLAAATGLAAAQKGPMPAAKTVEAPAAQETVTDDPLGRSTPQGTVVGFMRAAEKDDFERAVEYLDTKQPAPRAQQLARRLRYILEWDFLLPFQR